MENIHEMIEKIEWIRPTFFFSFQMSSKLFKSNPFSAKTRRNVTAL